MTVENCIKRYKDYILKGNKKAADGMRLHMLTANKFKGHPFLKELGKKEAPVKEANPIVKKSKR